LVSYWPRSVVSRTPWQASLLLFYAVMALCRFRVFLCHHLAVRKQTNAQIPGFVDHLSVSLDPAIGDAQRQPALHHALEVDAVFHQLDVIRDLAGELYLSAQGAPPARLADPAQEKSGHLPDGIEPQAARHY